VSLPTYPITDFAALLEEVKRLHAELSGVSPEQAAGAARDFIARNLAQPERPGLYDGSLVGSPPRPAWEYQFDTRGNVRPLITTGAVMRPDLRDALWDVADRAVRLAKDPKKAYQQRLLAACREYLEALGEAAEETKRRGSRTARDSKLDARDKWIYQQCCEGTPYKDIVKELKECHRKKGWRRISSVQGVRQATSKYAERHNLPPITRRVDK
jgi:hypothetical protein